MQKKKRRLNGLEYDFNEMDILSKTSKIMEELDPDLYEYFDDMRLVKKKTNKTKSKKARFQIGDQVKVGNSYGTIIYGPYKSDFNKDTYEIETEDGGIITAEDNGNNISLYVPPVEEESDEDDLL